MVNESDIERLVESVSIPINIMAMPNLPSFSRLKELGVKRLSSGPFIYQKYKKDHTSINEQLSALEKKQSFSPLFE